MLLSILLALAIVFLLWRDFVRVSETAKLNAEKYKAPSTSPAATPAVITSKNYPQATPTDVSQWIKRTIELYSITLLLTPEWTITETNRRPEPTGPEQPVKGHDCANYVITGSNGYVSLALKPTCGFSDGGAELWPDDAVIVKTYSGDTYPKYIIRFFDKETSLYRYASAGEATISDIERGTRTEKTYASPPVIGLGAGQDLQFIAIELRFNGPEIERNSYLQMVDSVITSLAVTP